MLTDQAQRALDVSDKLVNDWATDANTDLRAIREALVAVVHELAELRSEIREAAGRG